MAKALSITKRVKFINKKKVSKVVLNKNIEAFVLYITSFNLDMIMIIHLARRFK